MRINIVNAMPQKTATSDQSLLLATAEHQAGHLQEAQALYRAILQNNPNHPEANHNMGVLAVQMMQPAAGLPYLMAALESEPAQRQYWLSYIDALFQADQPEAATEVLALARQQGLQGAEVDALAERVAAAHAECQPAHLLPATSGTSKNNQTKPAQPGKSTPHPGHKETNTLTTLFAKGRYAEAEKLARKMTERYPRHEFGWKVLGMVFKQTGRNEDALVPMQKAAALSPFDAQAQGNLGVVLKDMGHLNEAEACYRRALQINSHYAQAHGNLGAILKDTGRLIDAETSLRRAIQISPDYAEAHNNLGLTLQSMGRLDDACASYRRALQIKPDFADAHSNLGIVLRDMGRLDEALTHFQIQAQLAPDNAVAQHLISSLTGRDTERAPVQYVEGLFNSYADKFDTHLQQTLQYDVPEKLAALVKRHMPVAENVLDLGCGTGLAGAAIAPFAKELVGVDLSSKMLEKARARNIYQRLECLDLLTMMRGEPASSYDLIIAADVFIYLGKLDEIICEIKRLLRPCGFFSFSVETIEALPKESDIQCDQREYLLEKTGRYAHSARYLTRLALAHDFQIQEMIATQLRKEHDKSVNGYLALWKA